MKYETVKKYIDLFFGNTSNQRFRRFIILISMLLISFVIIQNIEFGFDKSGNWYFKLKPAAEIQIKK